ncbi:MAG TPA: putative inorganic carbon transporter subunit DabA [Nitrospiraceae bacterium]|nr:putative inorganic carbon transporter subunit DabA [Nitrospiraceae bacterium]
MAKQLDTSPNQDDASADVQRERLRSQVSHAAEILHEQGPIGTFIHTNPFHSLEHLHFEQAVVEAERLTGGHTYLPNDEFRRLYRTGRITDHDVKEALVSHRLHKDPETFVVGDDRIIDSYDVLRLHLLHGIDPLDPAHLSWQVHHEQATKRFREDLLDATRTILLEKAKTDLRLSLDRIGREWTLSDWVQTQLNLNLPGHVRKRLCHELREGPITSQGSGDVERRFSSLEIPPDRREGYRRCIDRQLDNIGIFATEHRDTFHVHWLQAEYECLRRLVPRHLGVTGTFSGLASGCEHDLEAYAVTRLWHVALAARGLDDPLSLTNPETLTAENCSASRLDSLHRRIVAVEKDCGLALPLTGTTRTAIEEEVHFVARRRERRRAILLGLCRISGPVDPNQMPPLTLTEEAEAMLQTPLPSGIRYSTGLIRLAAELRFRKGFDWQIWDEVLAQPLFLSASPVTSPVNDRPLRVFLRDELRVRLTEDIRQALQEKFSLPRLDPHAEDRRRLVLDGLKEEGLTFIAWEVLQDDIDHWDDLDTTGSVDPVVEERLCRIVLDGLRETELTRPAYDALRQLIELCDRTSACLQLLADLRHMDPRQHLVKHAREDLAATMSALGHDLTLSDFLRELTEFDIVDWVNRYMIKWCGAFLDEGISGIPMPGREQGFYLAWKNLAAGELSMVLGGIDGWNAAVLALPDRADDSLLQTLSSLQIDDHHQSDYVSRWLLQLPGWAGLIKWREHHPQHPQQQRHHIDLIEYLAVRLFCESMLIKQLCHNVWGLDGTVQSLHHFHRKHPCEFFVRREFHRGGLPDSLQTCAHNLISSNLPCDQEEWVRMAEMVWIYRDATAPGRDSVHTLCRNAWRLFHLAQLLGLSAGEMQTLSVSDVDRLIATLEEFPSSAHGPVWQRAYEGHYQKDLLKGLDQNMHHGILPSGRSRAQMVFCIDEREESIRRHVESRDPAYETFGTAGFFGVVMNYTGLRDHGSTPLCPVVVTPSIRVLEESREDQGALWSRSSRREKWLVLVERLFSLLKHNLVTSYILIDLTAAIMGVVLLGKVLLPRRFDRIVERLHHWFVPPVLTTLTIDALNAPGESRPHTQQLGFMLNEQIGTVEGQLRIIGLTKNFARLVVFVGHGSTSQNNPHESAHDCGACGGKHGGPNARTLASMANKPEVRFALRERGVDIPGDTYFIGAQHNTASDRFTYFETERIPTTHQVEFERLVRDVDDARALNAQERCRLLPLAPKGASPAHSLRHMERRSVDFSQVHPEWGHATNASVVVGRRALTQGHFMDRRTFLQSYDPDQDTDGTILERIMTAVGPVVAGIGLEYYFSRVDNLRYGSGTKVPHNVTGLVGVMDGAQSDLRTGLPFQMVWVHEPMRLTIVVEGRPAIVSSIVQKHRNLQKLFDNMWLHLIVLDIHAGRFTRYLPDGKWSTISTDQPAVLA